MMSGFDRYFQIARCFRDEDLRADRQPEFTQIDIETTFMNEQEIMDLVEDLLVRLFKSSIDVDLGTFPVLKYADAMAHYGSDKPDLRFDLPLVEVSDLMQSVEFKVFAGPAQDAESRVAALRVPDGERLSRRNIDDYTKFVAIYGARGLAYIRVNDLSAGIDGLQSPILKFLPDDVVTQILERVSAVNGDIVFFGADKSGVVNDALGSLRCRLAEDLDLYERPWAPCWIVDFPMFEKDNQGNWTALHHPFTAPSVDAETLLNDPGEALSRAYDVVINGYEVGGGSVRINQTEMQNAIFNVLQISHNEA